MPKHIFNPIITRDFRPPKPDPAGILHIASSWGLCEPSKTASETTETVQLELLPIIMVGDSIDDIVAGYRAGAATVLLQNESNRDVADHPYTDLCIRRLDELIGVLENGFHNK